MTTEIVEKIIGCLKPSIQALLKMYGREFIHVKVVSPHDGQTLLFDGPVGGNVEKYPKRYDNVAEMKAELSVRTGMNSADVLNNAPHVMIKGDIIYQGSVNLAGLVVASSSAQAPVDEAVSYMIAINIKAYCQVMVQERQKEAAAGGPYTM